LWKGGRQNIAQRDTGTTTRHAGAGALPPRLACTAKHMRLARHRRQHAAQAPAGARSSNTGPAHAAQTPGRRTQLKHRAGARGSNTGPTAGACAPRKPAGGMAGTARRPRSRLPRGTAAGRRSGSGRHSEPGLAASTSRSGLTESTLTATASSTLTMTGVRSMAVAKKVPPRPRDDTLVAGVKKRPSSAARRHAPRRRRGTRKHGGGEETRRHDGARHATATVEKGASRRRILRGGAGRRGRRGAAGRPSLMSGATGRTAATLT
jgi:hypothetical protein